MPEFTEPRPHRTIELDPTKKIVVEIGSDKNPTFRIGTRQVAPDEHWLTVNLHPETVAEEKAMWRDRPDIIPIQADALHLPLPDASVDEVIYQNIFNDPRSTTYWDGEPQYEPGTWLSGPGRQINGRTVAHYLAEAARVLKVGGKVLITDTITPHEGRNRVGIDQDEVRGLRMIPLAIQAWGKLGRD